jgi:hypothetical protein
MSVAGTSAHATRHAVVTRTRAVALVVRTMTTMMGGGSISLGASRHRHNSSKDRCFGFGVRNHFSRQCTNPRKVLLANVDDEHGQDKWLGACVRR